jgi:hypothetical protein
MGRSCASMRPRHSSIPAHQVNVQIERTAEALDLRNCASPCAGPGPLLRLVDYRVDCDVRHVHDGICILLIHVHSFVMELRRGSPANSFCVEGL